MQHETRLTAYPRSWNQHTPALSGEHTLDVTGFELNVTLSEVELQHVYYPLLAHLFHLADASRLRPIAGLAGIPGSGKSTFAATLARVARTVEGDDALATVSLDGWHWENRIHEWKHIRDVDGQRVPLKQRKGCPESFNVPVYAQTLRQLQRRDENLRIPVYDRNLHEPVRDRQKVPRSIRVILTEGNYILSSVPPWDVLHTILSTSIALHCDMDRARDRVIQRHRRGGRSREDAIVRYERNDLHNTRIVVETLLYAEIHVRFDPEPEVVRRTLAHS